jgi:hypothetical protein
VWFQDDAERLIEATIRLVRIENIDAQSVVGAVAVAAAVAASSVGMTGRDLVLAASETSRMAIERLDEISVSRIDRAHAVPDSLARARTSVGATFHVAESAFSEVDEGLVPPLAAVVLAAGPGREPSMLIDMASSAGGADAAAVSGAVLGARLGLRRWPWRVPNETWFAEIGRRLVTHSREVGDLPIPRSVEERVNAVSFVDPAREIE